MNTLGTPSPTTHSKPHISFHILAILLKMIKHSLNVKQPIALAKLAHVHQGNRGVLHCPFDTVWAPCHPLCP